MRRSSTITFAAPLLEHAESLQLKSKWDSQEPASLRKPLCCWSNVANVELYSLPNVVVVPDGTPNAYGGPVCCLAFVGHPSWEMVKVSFGHKVEQSSFVALPAGTTGRLNWAASAGAFT